MTRSPSPDALAAAWRAWHDRHGGRIGPGPAFKEAVTAAMEVEGAADRLHIERTLVDYIEGLGVEIEHRNGWEWIVEIDGIEVSLSGLAIAIMDRK